MFPNKFFIASFFILPIFLCAASSLAKNVVTNSTAIEKFYKESGESYLWVSRGKLNSDARDILELFEKSWEHGLNPENYHLAALKQIEQNGVPEERTQDTEILFSDAVVQYARDISGMRLSPKILEEDSNSWSRGVNGTQILALLADENNPAKFLEMLLPQDDEYKALVAELRRTAEGHAKKENSRHAFLRYRAAIQPNEKNAGVPAIRARLGDDGKSDIYDESLQKKVMDFQRQNGLMADAIIGRRTYEAFNRTHEDKLIKLIANLERRRWVKRPLLSRRVEVNIPRMYLKAIDDNKVRFEMPVIIGREKRPTVSFVDKIEGVRFNPRWYVPDTIKKEDFLPKLKKNPHAVDDHGIIFRVNNGNGFKTVDPSRIDWANMSEADLKNVQMYQDSGEENALGVVRVLMPNKYDIYLHDTNAPSLFKKNDRALSSGCVRLSEPKRIANFVLEENLDWSEGKMNGLIEAQKLREVKAAQPIPVYLFYFTSWLGENGNIIMTDDIYGLDSKIVKLLKQNGKIPFSLPNL